MKFSANWLRTLVNPSCADQELAHKLTMAGLETESVIPVAPEFSGVVVAQVIAVQKHSNADRLKVCVVDVGASSEQPLQIVCGAPNVTEGMKVACALVGAKLPEMTIRQGQIRGVESAGMLCSAQELGLHSEADGLIELPADAPIGLDLRQHLILDDNIFTLQLTPNRADCLGMFGIAREVATITASEFVLPKVPSINVEITDTLAVQIDEPESCPLYCGRIVRDINIDVPTPQWLIRHLERSGLRSINPIVDITNYVMLEAGQPMHAFDLAKIGVDDKRKIVVRFACENESLLLLNGEHLDLHHELLVIADGEKPLALAGIMGGDASGVEQSVTTDIFLESAYFSPDVVSGKSFELGFTSDSAHRFERGVDFAETRNALERATAMVLDICGGKAGPVTEIKNKLPQRNKVQVRQTRVEKILGVALSIDLIKSYFDRLQFDYVFENNTFHVIPPSYRFDLVIEEDFIEELARIHGYDAIPASLPKAQIHMLPAAETGKSSIEVLRKTLVARDYQEVINYTFVDQEWELDFAENQMPIRLANPIASHMSVMRSSLFGGLINNLEFNLNRRQNRVRIFEIGSCFRKINNEKTEAEYLAGLCSGSALPEQWGTANRNVDFFDVKMDIEALFWPQQIHFERATHPALHPGKAARILSGEEEVGWIGELHPRWKDKYRLSQTAVLFELVLSSLAKNTLPQMQSLSKFPPVRRDIALVVENDVSVGELLAAMRNEKSKIITEIALFDFYSGEKLEKNKKSLAFRILLQDIEKTLTDQEIDQSVSDLVDMLGRKFGTTLRN